MTIHGRRGKLGHVYLLPAGLGLLALLSSHADAAPQATDRERPPEQDNCRPGSEDADAFGFDDSHACNTPRGGTLSGMYLGFGAGLQFLRDAAMERERIGPGGMVHVYLGLAFWDHLLVELRTGGSFPHDRQPFSELVMNCLEGGVFCGAPRASETSVSAEFLGLELGAQYRFRPASWMSLAPGVMLGAAGPLRNFTRGVSDCVDCTEQELDASPGGTHLAGFLRITFGETGIVGLTARSQLGLTGDIAHAHTLSLEVGMP